MTAIDEKRAVAILIWTVGLSYLSAYGALELTNIGFAFGSAKQLTLIVAVIGLFLAYAVWRKMIVLPAAFACLAATFASIPPILIWTYAAMRLDMPLADAPLVAMDAALGFDWYRFIAFVDSSPLLARLLGEAYSSFYFQLLFLPVLLALFRREQRAYAMVFAYYLLCALSSIVSIWYPALGTYVVYDVAAADLANINAKFGFFFLEQFHAVREAGSFTLRLDQSAGILTFPSVHAGVAMLCAWAAWDVKWLRYPFALLNVAMAISAISHANHYLIDVIAGIALAGFCASIATLLFYRRTAENSVAATLAQPSPAAM